MSHMTTSLALWLGSTGHRARSALLVGRPRKLDFAAAL
jgi:hypothetical protein